MYLHCRPHGIGEGIIEVYADILRIEWAKNNEMAINPTKTQAIAMGTKFIGTVGSEGRSASHSY